MQRGANLDDDAGLAREVSVDAPGKGSLRGVARSPEAKSAASGDAGNTVVQYQAKPLQTEFVRPIREFEQERQNGNSG